jgi:hypothetical protein
MENTEKSKSQARRIIVILVIFFALFLYLFLGYPGRVVFRPQTFCRQAEADANYIYSAISDYISVPEDRDVIPTHGDIEMRVDIENPWRLTRCSDRFFIHVIDRSGKCPAEYQNQYQEWNSNIYTLEF